MQEYCYTEGPNFSTKTNLFLIVNVEDASVRFPFLNGSVHIARSIISSRDRSIYHETIFKNIFSSRTMKFIVKQF